MVFANITPDRLTSTSMETGFVNCSATEPPRTPALDWKEFFGE